MDRETLIRAVIPEFVDGKLKEHIAVSMVDAILSLHPLPSQPVVKQLEWKDYVGSIIVIISEAKVPITGDILCITETEGGYYCLWRNGVPLHEDHKSLKLAKAAGQGWVQSNLGNLIKEALL